MGHRNQLRQLRGGHETPGGYRDPQHLSPRCPVGLGVPQACLAQTPRATTTVPFRDPLSSQHLCGGGNDSRQTWD